MRELNSIELISVSGGVSPDGDERKIPIHVIKEGIGGLAKILSNVDWSAVRESFIPKPHWNQPMTMWHGGF
ncbi:hypothetical protein HX37_23965 [Salmonella enterica]|uniref:Uncharacterized protein n=2 Tax=Salmonella enterica I TaxID=59201 RepID=A0A5U3G5H4_SALET|nr:hypothetical protein [Salmonella enterica]EBH9884240.1 hypothetical protein [Salmonella enterica subsp. enterica serovar Kisarawe]EBP4061079.1 hypothetical protein [Salmonella enterica subsp. enterica]EBS0228741.1 hypothetical protein [Salmonella enterica subsp. enterica serovar Schwarzengrund]EAS5879231.1 hypothetical protein [Salmonella enterica]